MNENCLGLHSCCLSAYERQQRVKCWRLINGLVGDKRALNLGVVESAVAKIPRHDCIGAFQAIA